MAKANEWLEQWRTNWEALVASDRQAKIAGELVGRYIAHPFADGNAYYRITKVTKTTARIEVVTGLGDDWVLPAWGRAISLPLRIARDFIRRRDGWDAVFAQAK